MSLFSSQIYTVELGPKLMFRYKLVQHLVCLWHVVQNLKKQSNYLAILDGNQIKDSICFLPYLKNTKKFGDDSKKIIKFLKLNKLKKTDKYIEKFYEKKEKCSIVFQAIISTPGIQTTSRAESTNSAIKSTLKANQNFSISLTLSQIMKKQLQCVNLIYKVLIKVNHIWRCKR